MGFGEIDRRAHELARKAGRVPPEPGKWTPPPSVAETRQARRAAEAARRTSERSQLRADQALIDHDREAARRTGIAIGLGITLLSATAGLWLVLRPAGSTRPTPATTRTTPPAPSAPDAGVAPAPVTELSGVAPPAPGLPPIAVPAPALATTAGRAAFYRTELGAVDGVLHAVRFDAAVRTADTWPGWLPPEKVAQRVAAVRMVAASATTPTTLDRAALAYADVLERDLSAWQAAAGLRARPDTRAEGVAQQAPLSEALGAASAALRAELAAVAPPDALGAHPYEVALETCRAGVDLLAAASADVTAVVERPAGAAASTYGAPPDAAALGRAGYACLDAVIAADRAHPGGAFLRDLLVDLGNELLSLRDQALAGHGLYPSHAAQLALFATEQLERLRSPAR